VYVFSAAYIPSLSKECQMLMTVSSINRVEVKTVQLLMLGSLDFSLKLINIKWYLFPLPDNITFHTCLSRS